MKHPRRNCTGRSPLNDSNIRSQRPEKRIPPREKLRTLSTTQQKKKTKKKTKKRPKKDKKRQGKNREKQQKKTKKRQFFNTLGTPLYISKMTTIEKKMAKNCPKTIDKNDKKRQFEPPEIGD